jgi:NADH-quinone oxidoreductase subunit E
VGYLPPDVLRQVAREMKVSVNQVYGVATFFKSLSLVPLGKHKVTVCLGTACHVRGGEKILAELDRVLKIKPDETTKDGKFTVKVVNCVGACAIGPVMIVDNQYYGKMTPAKVKGVLEQVVSKIKW